MRPLLLACPPLVFAASSPAAAANLKTPKAVDRTHGFEATAVYLDAADRQLDVWEQYLLASAGAGPRPLQRLYARHSWMP